MSDRFIIDGVGREVGILDTQKNVFAPFLGLEPDHLRWRLERTVARLNAGEETTTGFTWFKTNELPQFGAGEEEACPDGTTSTT